MGNFVRFIVQEFATMNKYHALATKRTSTDVKVKLLAIIEQKIITETIAQMLLTALHFAYQMK